MAIEAGGVQLAFDPAMGGRAVSWSVQGVELLGGVGAEPVEHGMYVMAPWAGRLRGNRVGDRALPATYGPWAIHGTVLDRPATVVRHDAASITFRSLIGPGHDAWPWHGSVEAFWSVGEQVEPGPESAPGVAVQTRIAVHAEREPFPVTIGWHPWFTRRPGGPHIDLPATTRLRRGDDHLPTGDAVTHVAAPGTYDDTFTVPSRTVTLRWRDPLLAVDVTSSSEWFVVFDQRPDAVCVEPQNGPPDGLRAHSGWRPQVATPGAPVVLEATWIVSGGRDREPGNS